MVSFRCFQTPLDLCPKLPRLANRLLAYRREQQGQIRKRKNLARLR